MRFTLVASLLNNSTKSLSVRNVVKYNSQLANAAPLDVDDQVQDEAWNSARPYSEIPGPSYWEMFKMFRPGGELDKIDPFEMAANFQKRYGNLCKLPGVAGKKDLVFVFEPEDIETIYRTEGKYPVRELLDSLIYHRQVLRRDVYSASAGLTSEQGESWWDMRKKVNPVMMKPHATKVYVPKMDEISSDFVNMIEKMKDSENRLTDQFLPLLSKWALESVCYVSMDIRIGLLGENPDPKAEEFMLVLKRFLEHIYQIDIQPSLWKYYKTPLFKAAMKNNDAMVE